jgi:hypothetical protein
MGYRVAGLCISLRQMLQMASHLKNEEMKDIHVAFNICCDEAENAGSRWVPVDYPKNSKNPVIVLMLYEHEGDKRISIKKWNESHRAKTARKWLADRGVLDAENLRFVSVDDPLRR